MDKQIYYTNILKVLLSLMILCVFFVHPIQATIYGSISGQVTDEETGKGIPGIGISILGRTRAEVLTDAEGKYLKNLLKPGKYNVIFNFHSPYCRSSSGGTLYINPGQNIVLNSVFKIGGSVSGRVYESDGITPIGSATINVIRYGGGVGKTETKADGSYSMCCLCPTDDYYISVDSNIPGIAYIIFLGIKVEKGKDTNVLDVVFDLDDITGIEGIITSSIDGKPIPDAEVAIWNYKIIDPVKGEPIEIGSVNTNENGYYYIKNLEPGEYKIYVLPPVGDDISYEDYSKLCKEKESIIIKKSEKTKVNLELGFVSKRK